MNYPAMPTVKVACSGFTSYIYKGDYGWIWIGSDSTEGALAQAKRSLSFEEPELHKLYVWCENLKTYLLVQQGA